MEHAGWVTSVLAVLDLLIRLGLSLRVIMRRLPVGVSLAWLAVILAFPVVGAAVYLLVGEYRLGRWRQERATAIRNAWHDWLTKLHDGNIADDASLGPESAALARVAQFGLDSPPLAGNQLQLLRDAEAAFPVLIADIDRAKRTCHLEFYIWTPG